MLGLYPEAWGLHPRLGCVPLRRPGPDEGDFEPGPRSTALPTLRGSRGCRYPPIKHDAHSGCRSVTRRGPFHRGVALWSSTPHGRTPTAAPSHRARARDPSMRTSHASNDVFSNATNRGPVRVCDVSRRATLVLRPAKVGTQSAILSAPGDACCSPRPWRGRGAGGSTPAWFGSGPAGYERSSSRSVLPSARVWRLP